MSEHIDNWVEAWLAGRVSDERERELEAHTRRCERCADIYREHADDIAGLARALPSMDPPGDLKSRLLGQIRPADRFERFADKTADLIDVSRTRALELLESIDDDANWEEGPAPAVSLFHIDGGPATADAIVGFIRVDSGEAFPEHEHHGTERVLVLQGAIRDSGGERFLPGDVCVMNEGTEHHLVAEDGPPLIYLVVVDEGVSIGGHFIGPDDPEL